MSAPQAYFNGSWVPSDELRIPVGDAGFLFGATVSERLRTFRGKVFRLEQHWARIRQSMEIVGLDADKILPQIEHVPAEFVERNRNLIDPDDDWTLTAFATAGDSPSNRSTCVYGFPIRFDQFAAAYDSGLPAVISDIRQVPDNCWPSKLKCRSRMHYFLADRHAQQKQPGARPILLDQDGYVAESTTANVLIYRDSEGLSSPPDDHILVGISLGVVHELAGRLGIPFMRRRIAADELATADEVLLASTSICLLPIVQLNGRSIGTGAPGPIFKRLLAAWSDTVGVDIAAQARRFASRDGR
jgi:branched-subunit amino acid aminotransferase/4-amino-4-deoxychorismate lyase